LLNTFGGELEHVFKTQLEKEEVHDSGYMKSDSAVTFKKKQSSDLQQQ